MKRTTASAFLPISLGIGLVVSLGINIYQLYPHSTSGHAYAEVADTEVETGHLQHELQLCHRESILKDSVIALLKQDASTASYPSMSAQRSP